MARDITVKTLANLASLKVGYGDHVTTQGYIAAGDGGGNEFEFINSVITPDAGLHIGPPAGVTGTFRAVDRALINAKQFGMLPGRTAAQNTTALTAAINALGAAGGTVHIPQGIYELNTVTIHQRANIVIRGEGSGHSVSGATGIATLLTLGSGAIATTPIFLLTNAASDVSTGGIRFEGLTMYGDVSGFNRGYGIHLQVPANGMIGYVEVHNCGIYRFNNGIYGDNPGGGDAFVGYFHVNNCRIERNGVSANGPQSANGFGINLTTQANGVSIRDNTIRQNNNAAAADSYAPTAGGISVIGVRITIDGNVMEGQQCGVVCAGQSISITDNYFEAMTNAAAVVQSGNQITISGNSGDTTNSRIFLLNMQGGYVGQNYGCEIVQSSGCRGITIHPDSVYRPSRYVAGTTIQRSVVAIVPIAEAQSFSRVPPARIIPHGYTLTGSSANMTWAASAIHNPQGRLQSIQATGDGTGTPHIGLFWEPHFGVTKKYVVAAAQLWWPTASPGAGSWYSQFFRGVNGAANTLLFEGPLSAWQQLRDEWVVAYWIYERLASETTIQINTRVQMLTGQLTNVIHLGGVACWTTDWPFEYPECWDLLTPTERFSHNIAGQMISMENAAPTNANVAWKVGDYVKRGTPVVGQPKGWYCTVAGSPGTWVSEGIL